MQKEITFKNKTTGQILKLVEISDNRDWKWSCKDSDSQLLFAQLACKVKDLDKELKKNWEIVK
jgi:hypothetical protein